MPRLAEKMAIIFATGFGSGYSPVAPGTVGSILSIPIFFGLCNLNIFLYLITVVGIFFIGLWASDFAGRHFGDVDSPKIVIDEIIGMLITYLPLYHLGIGLKSIVLGFVLFRLFDIIKPFPANRINAIKRPIFVLLDDLISAVYAAIILIMFNIFIF